MTEPPTIISLSGGKDSTAMLIEMIELGEPFDEIIFADTGMEFPEMYAHLDLVEDKLHVGITRVRSDKPWDYWMFDHVKTRGKTAGERGYGWPMASARGMRWCTTRLKKDPMRKYISANYDVKPVECIGIAFDEAQRVKFDDPLKRYPLVEIGMTEAMALKRCYDYGFDWGGLYEIFGRVSCWCCPFQSNRELRSLYYHRPGMWKRLMEMDAHESTRNSFRAKKTLTEFDSEFADYYDKIAAL